MADQNNRDELDLFLLLLKVVNIIRANFWMIVIFFVVGSSLGIAYFFSSRKVFENKMIISSGILTESYSKVLFDNINRHLWEGNDATIATLFNIPAEDAGKVLSFTIETFAKLPVGAENRDNERFIITAEVADQQLLPALQRGVVGYLENNPYVKVRVEQNKNALKQTLTEIDEEIADLNEFKTSISTGTFFQNVKGSLMFDPTAVNSKILELKERKISLRDRLELSNSVQVIEGFNRFEHQTKPRLSISIAAGSVVGLFFVGLLIAFKSIRKLISLAEEVK